MQRYCFSYSSFPESSRLGMNLRFIATYCCYPQITNSHPPCFPHYIWLILQTQSYWVTEFFILTQRYKDTMFFVSGRYKEQLKLLYKVHKDFHPQGVFLNTETQRHWDFFGCGRYREQLKLLLQRTQSYLPQCKSPRGIRGAGGFLCRKGSVSSVACDHLYKHHKSLPLLISVV